MQTTFQLVISNHEITGGDVVKLITFNTTLILVAVSFSSIDQFSSVLLSFNELMFSLGTLTSCFSFEISS